MEFPVIDLANLAAQTGDDGVRLMAACSQTGFFYVTNHKIAQQQIDEIFGISKQLFDLPLDVKEQYPITNNIGYTRIGQERLVSMDLVDYKEGFNFPSSFNLATDAQLPPVIKENQAAAEAFTRSCHAVGCTILRAMAIGLGLEPDFFQRGHTYGKASGGIFRLLRYPAVPDSVDTETTIRAGSHSDYGTLTLLFQESPPAGCEAKASGLQVRMGDSWHDVPARTGCVVVNVADLLSFWTEGRLRSALHRVILPTDELKKVPRYSTVFFMHPDGDHIIRLAPSPLPAPFPAKQVQEDLVATFGPSPFTYNQTGTEYLWRRLNLTYTENTY